MTLSDTVARALMNAALGDAPADRRSWVMAMSAEFETLDRDRLSWAFGCWSAVARWNAGRDALALIGAAVLVLTWERTWPWLSFHLPVELTRDVPYLWTFGPAAVFAGLLAFCFPRHSGKLAVIASLVPWINGAVYSSMVVGQNLLTTRYTFMDAPPMIGYLAFFGACYLTADLGRRLAALRALPSAPRPS